MSLLLLFLSGGGSIMWSGPNPIRTARVEPEVRIVRVSPG